ncbi:MAG TPA: hypothetical protein VFI72_00095 [Candidatus Angelobacter sp.]|jgi:hypothetical protein|nr:hypothetical protein [Candidatus Angelobacter sp.]
MAKQDSEETQQFNTTLIIAITLAALLAFGFLAIVYGCAKANNAPKTNTPTTGSAVLRI